MNPGRILCLSGGIGGAKLALGFSHLLPSGHLGIAVNVGDDFIHLGLRISPDIDTVMYTLAGIANSQTGWGLENETWSFMDAMDQLGGETWFRLGDRDLATHVLRTELLKAGVSLSNVTARMCRQLHIVHDIFAVTDGPFQTIVDTSDGSLSFQEYFVHRQCRPAVSGIRFQIAETATVSPEFLASLQVPDLAAIVICPSNPYLSVDPMLAVPGLRAKLLAARVPIIAVSPIIGGQAVKGPTAKIMDELSISRTSVSVARHYRGLIDGLVIDVADRAEAAEIEMLNITAFVANTRMMTLQDKTSLAAEILEFAQTMKAANFLTKRVGTQ